MVIQIFEVLSKLFNITMLIVFLLFIIWQVLNRRDINNKVKRYVKTKQKLLLLGILIGSIPFVSSAIYTSLMRSEVKEFLNTNDLDSYMVYIDNKKVLNKNEILDELRKVKFVKGHHSGKENSYIVVSLKSSENSIKFHLHKDTKRDREYWVYTNFFKNGFKYIGRIHSEFEFTR